VKAGLLALIDHANGGAGRRRKRARCSVCSRVFDCRLGRIALNGGDTVSQPLLDA
jgi:hypothetical protein